MSEQKTLAMKLLEGKNIPYSSLTYPPNLRDAEEVASALDLNPSKVFKTLVVSRTPPGKPLLVMIPANEQLNLKKVAKAVNEKKVKMASQKDAENLTGLQVGGISALALINRGFSVYINNSAATMDQITISAGQRGYQVTLSVEELIHLTGAKYIDAV